mmetsp:Transcript_62652/g.159325  ORF Transcript_62652/g.159325 Transcript_62652/m.159325 type:complete len:352 (+) Transcript_62652:59-1114(+)
MRRLGQQPRAVCSLGLAARVPPRAAASGLCQRQSAAPLGSIASTSSVRKFRRRWFDLRDQGGVRHSALEWTGPPEAPLVLFLHATSFCAGSWVPVVKRLSKQVHAVAVDLRAHGDTDAPALGSSAYHWEEFGRDFQRLAARIAAEHGRPIDACVTHSFIGDCALMALAEASAPRADVKRMVLLDPVLADEEGATTGAQRLAKGTRRVGEREAQGFDSAAAVGEALEKLLRVPLHPEAKAALGEFGAFSDDAGRWRLKCRRDNEAEIYANRVAIAEHLEGHRVNAEVKLVFSSRRRAKPEDQEASFVRDLQVAERVVARCGSGSAVEVLDGVGHFLVLEDPDLVAGTLDALL